MFSTTYLVELTCCWVVFYGFYVFFLEQETFFRSNRIYLLVSLAAGIGIPFLVLPNTPTVAAVQTVQFSIQTFSQGMEQKAALPTLLDILTGIYWLGVLFFAGRFFKDLWAIFQLYRNGKTASKTGYQLVLTDQNHPPFSFIRWIFLSEASLQNADDDTERIIEHERTHIKGGHSLDVLLLHLLQIFFWFNPMIYLYKKSLQDVHEFLADFAVTRHTSVQQYGQLLLRQALPDWQLALSNHFNHSQLKKRINMMTKKQSSNWAVVKYALVLPLLLAVAVFFSAYRLPENITQPMPQNAETATMGEVDEYPRFPGCEEKATLEEKTTCSNQKLVEFISPNFKYPEKARKAGIEGMVVISFVVQANGKMKSLKISKGIGGGCEESALEIVKKMQQEVTWVPGKKDGKAVNVEMSLPFAFRLDNKKEKKN